MACAVDASTPIRFTASAASNSNIDSASFTAPVNSLLVLCLEHDGSPGSGDPLVITVSLTTGTALTWTEQVRRDLTETTSGGAALIFTAPAVTSEARVVRVNSIWTNNTGASLRRSAKLYVVTGADLDGTPVDTVGANNEGGDTANNNLTTTGITPGANGLHFGADCEWSALGSFESPSDGSTQDTTTYAGAISVCDGYKTCTSGVSSTMNLNAAGTGSPQHKYAQIIVREEPVIAPSVAAEKCVLVPIQQRMS